MMINKMKYSKEMTERLSIVENYKHCHKLVNTIIKKESKEMYPDYKDICFEDAVAVDFDCIKDEKCKGKQKCKSVDMMVCLNDSKLLLIELKLRAGRLIRNKKVDEREKSSQYIKKIKELKYGMKRKLCDSKKIIDSMGKTEYSTPILIICNLGKALQNRINQKNRDNSLYKVLTLQQFKQRYF